MDIELLKLKAYVEISSYRLKTVKAIGENIKTPTKIAEDSEIKRNHMSKVLRELKEHGIAECINEEMKKGRLYRLTEQGLQVNKMIKEEEVL